MLNANMSHYVGFNTAQPYIVSGFSEPSFQPFGRSRGMNVTKDLDDIHVLYL